MPNFDVLLGAFGAGIYVIVALIHLDLWARRREQLGHLWLAAASASALVVDVTGIVAALKAPDVPAVLLGLNILGVAGATIFLRELVSALSRIPTGRGTRCIQALVAIGALATAVVPQVTGAVLIACGLVLIAAVARAVQAARSGQDTRMVARAFLVLAACLLADLLKELSPLPIPSNLPLLGFTILFLAAARSLNDRFEREHDASRHDALTGLRNRRSLIEAWEEALQRRRRSGRPLSIVLADLDHFKRINDTHGHVAGDATLCAAARAIQESLRAQDTVSRWGGEEFMLLLPDTDGAGARHVAESIRRAIEALRLEHEGVVFGVTLSLGVAEHLAERSMEATIEEADSALYRAKQDGRNRVGISPAPGTRGILDPQKS